MDSRDKSAAEETRADDLVLDLYGHAITNALCRAIEERALSADQLEGLWYLLSDYGVVGAGSVEEKIEAVERDVPRAPASKGGDGDGSPPVRPSPPAKPGSPRNPVLVETGEDVDRVSKRVQRRMSPEQARAGNYRKGHLRLHGIDIAIETPKGGYRKGVDKDGKPWRSHMPAAAYGYAKMTSGADGDAVDVYIGPHVDSGKVFVIDQIDPETGKFDEVKTVLGARAAREAERFYAASFSDGKGRKRIGGTREFTVEEFRAFLKDGGGKKPVSKAA